MGSNQLSDNQHIVSGVVEIDGETCHYQMSIGHTSLYKGASGREYITNEHFGVIPLNEMIRMGSSWRTAIDQK
ncbi:MAG TPA: hypothetical protein VFR01_05975 [Geobacterales bacterium]|nr:hypothetical protein [Geobacterales bacterium]